MLVEPLSHFIFFPITQIPWGCNQSSEVKWRKWNYFKWIAYLAYSEIYLKQNATFLLHFFFLGNTSAEIFRDELRQNSPRIWFPSPLNFQNFANLLSTQMLLVQILPLPSVGKIFFPFLLLLLLLPPALNSVPAVLGAVILHQRTADYFHLVSLVRKWFWHALTPCFLCINMRAMEKLQTVNK